MKSTFDTNIFVYGVLSKRCSETIQTLINNPNDYTILRSVNEETVAKLRQLSVTFSILHSEYDSKTDTVSLLESRRYENFRQKYPQIHKIILEYVKKGHFGRDKKFDDFSEFLLSTRKGIKKLLALLDKEKYMFPVRKEDYQILLKDKEFTKVIKSLSFIKNLGDQRHLAISSKYIEQSKHELLFITLDKKDFIKNKAKIEEMIKGLTIKELQGFNPENFTIIED